MPRGKKTTRFEQDRKIAVAFVRMQKEHAAMFDRLVESEEVSKDKDGRIYWSSCGEYIDGNGSVRSEEDE